jgi:hypothetical protein
MVGGKTWTEWWGADGAGEHDEARHGALQTRGAMIAATRRSERPLVLPARSTARGRGIEPLVEREEGHGRLRCEAWDEASTGRVTVWPKDYLRHACVVVQPHGGSYD